MLGGFRDWRLRTKFLAITVLAGLVPLVLYAWFPFRYSFNLLREIEEGLLKSKLNEIELLVRHERTLVEEEALRLASMEILHDQWENSEAATVRETSEARALRATACIEKGFYLYPGGELRAMRGFSPKNWKPDYDEQIQAAIVSSTREVRSSFFVAVGSDLILVACAPVGNVDETEAKSVPWVVLAVNLTRGLASQLGHLTQSQVSVGVFEETNGNSPTAGTTIGRTDDSALFAAKAIPALNNQTGYVRVTLPRALFGPLISSQFWAFLLFMASLYLAAIIGTTCAAAVVLKPLKRLTELMGSVGGPDTYRTRATEDRSDEIGELALSFNRLMSRLQMAQRELELVRKQEIEIEKLEAIHAMVITVAHEVNNPLTFILGQAELMLMEDDLTPENRNSLEVIRNMSLRIANVIKQLQDLQKTEMTSYIDWQQMIKLEPEPEAHVLSG